MAGVKTLADGNVRALLLSTRPADINAITVTEVTVGTGVKYISDRILASDFDLGPTGSQTIDEKVLDAKGNAQVFGLSQYGGGFSIVRFFDDATGKPDPTADWLWAAAKDKGSTLYLVTREDGSPATSAFAEDDEYRFFEVITDDPVRGDRSGYIKFRINCAVQYAALDKAIVAAG